jgi:hypothetical protein
MIFAGFEHLIVMYVFVRTVDYQLGQAPLLYHCLK